MELNEIKKALYKEKPTAVRFGETNEESFISNVIMYKAQLEDIGKIYFYVPKSEAVNFKDEEPAQLLIRWIY